MVRHPRSAGHSSSGAQPFLAYILSLDVKSMKDMYLDVLLKKQQAPVFIQHVRILFLFLINFLRYNLHKIKRIYAFFECIV